MIESSIVRLGWRQIRDSKRFWVCVALLLVPLVAGIISIAEAADTADEVSDTAPNAATDEYRMVYGTLWTYLVAFTVLPFTALILAGGLIADEVEDRTLSYLLVRPVKRARLYLSRLLPVALATAGFGAAQAAILGVTQVVSFSLYGLGDREWLDTDKAATTIATGPALALAIVGGIVAAILLGLGLSALFGFISLAIPKFHYVGNLLAYLVVELPFSQLGGLGLGALTVTFHAVSLMGRFDRTLGGAGVPAEAPWFVAVVISLLLTAFWTTMGLVRMRKRDFNITSAAS